MIEKLAIVAIGGNSLIEDPRKPDVEYKWDAVRKLMDGFAPADGVKERLETDDYFAGEGPCSLLQRRPRSSQARPWGFRWPQLQTVVR